MGDGGLGWGELILHPLLLLASQLIQETGAEGQVSHSCLHCPLCVNN